MCFLVLIFYKIFSANAAD